MMPAVQPGSLELLAHWLGSIMAQQPFKGSRALPQAQDDDSNEVRNWAVIPKAMNSQD